MIGTTKKPLDEVLAALEGYHKVFLVGCDGCAKICMTGGVDEVAALARELAQAGKEVICEATPERTCNVAKSGPVLEPLKDKIAEADTLLVLGCGGAVQIARQVVEKMGFTKPVKVGLNSVGHMDTLVPGTMALEECSDCGECILNETGGICPVTRCAKSLLNGPCGGAEQGKCEVDPNRDCAWVLIYNRMAALGELDRLKRYLEPKDYGKAARPRVLLFKEGRVA
jgi:ferredoxin